MATPEERSRAGGRRGIETVQRNSRIKQRIVLVILARHDTFTMAQALEIMNHELWKDFDWWCEKYRLEPYYTRQIRAAFVEGCVRHWWHDGLLERRHIVNAKSHGRSAYEYYWAE